MSVGAPRSTNCKNFLTRNEIVEFGSDIVGNTRDIGIKKRNHKLLDYDQLRAKVKKLVEKPDQDATKLPRVRLQLLE